MNINGRFLILLTLVFIFTGCQNRSDNNVNLPNEKEEAKEEVIDNSILILGSDDEINQSENPLLSNYSEFPGDGYLWRM